MTKSCKKLTIQAAKGVLTLLLVAVLYYQGALDLALINRIGQAPYHLFLAVVAIYAIFPLGAMRWYLLLKAIGFPQDYGTTNRINYKGAFVGLYLPGVVGVDIARLAISHTNSPGHLHSVAASLFIDRLLGMVGVILLGIAISLLVGNVIPEVFHVSDTPSWLGKLPMYLLISLSMMVPLLFLFMIFLRYGSVVIGRLEFKYNHRISHLLNKLQSSMGLYRRHPGVLFSAIAISVLAHLLDVAALAIIGVALFDLPVSPVIYALAGIFSSVINSVPLTPGGIGIGEAAYAQMMDRLSPAYAGTAFATVFLVHRVLKAAILLPGAILVTQKNA